MKKSIILLSLLTIACSALFSQENSIFTPFVSRLKAESGDNSITLTWNDTDDVDGLCIIYRNTVQITSENLSSAVKIARVAKDIEYYEDFPPYSRTDYYYAVFMEEPDGNFNEVFIPFRNLTTKGARIAEKIKDNSPSLITSLKAWATEEAIQLSFRSSKPASELFVYRNTEPIESRDDLLAANLIATIQGSASSYTDYPVPGIGYYYGIIDSNLIKTGNFIFKAGENFTSVPVEITLRNTERVGLPKTVISRPRPLPYLSLSRGFQTGRELSTSAIDIVPEKKDISTSTEAAVSMLLRGISLPATDVIEPVILKQDRNPAQGSERAILSAILNSEFSGGDYEAAKLRLIDFQKIRRDRDIEASASFYLGQVYYFLEDYNNSFKAFLKAQDKFYIESRPWIDSLFTKMRKYD